MTEEFAETCIPFQRTRVLTCTLLQVSAINTDFVEVGHVYVWTHALKTVAITSTTVPFPLSSIYTAKLGELTPFRAYSGNIRHGVSISLWENIWRV